MRFSNLISFLCIPVFIYAHIASATTVIAPGGHKMPKEIKIIGKTYVGSVGRTGMLSYYEKDNRNAPHVTIDHYNPETKVLEFHISNAGEGKPKYTYNRNTHTLMHINGGTGSSQQPVVASRRGNYKKADDLALDFSTESIDFID